MTRVFISLGTNLGDRKANLKRAAALLKKKMRIVKTSSLYKTKPMYITRQPWFLNSVVEGETKLTPIALLKYIAEIEQVLGRHRIIKYGPRLIDLDILFYGNKVVKRRDLQIPHPKLQERGFVLVPLAEIDPKLVHPIYKKTISELLAEIPDNKSVKKL